MDRSDLQEVLTGKPTDPLGFSHVGRLSLNVLEKLKEDLSLHNCGSDLKFSDGWFPEDIDFQFLPASEDYYPKKSISAISWSSSDGHFISLLSDLIPGITEVDGLEVGFMVGDYVGVHNDTHQHKCYEVGALCILLEAPKGCKLVSDGKDAGTLTVGDVFFLNDSLDHGVYPLETTALYDPESIQTTDQDLINFGKTECMKFLLVTKSLNGR